MENSPELILLEELASPKKTVKVGAIVKAAKATRDPKMIETLLKPLQELAASSDKEIALYARNAVTRLQLALASGTSGQTPQSSAGSANPAEITAERLLKAKAADAPAILETFRRAPEAIGEELRPLMAEFLKKRGKVQDAAIVERWLAESSGNLSVPYLEALETLDPARITAVLPTYLASEHPFVRSRAIAILDRIDPGEALAHLSELLGSDNAEERLAGLQIAFTFPLKDVSYFVLTLLAEETDQDVIQAAAVLLLSNPDPETALRLIELRGALPEPRKALIGKLLDQLCQTLVAVGMLEEGEATPEALAARFEREGLEKYLADLEIQLSLGDPERIESIVDWLRQNRGKPLVEAFIEKLGKSPATEEIHRRICPILEPELLQAGFPTGDIASASPERKVQVLRALPRDVPLDLAAWIRWEADSGEENVRVLALKALLNLSPEAGDTGIAERNLGNSNPMIASRAVSLLERSDPKRLAEKAGLLLNSPDPFIVSRGIMIAMRYREEDAVRTLSRMLRSEAPAARAQAVNCLMVCPFDRFAELVFEALPKETNINIAKGLLLLILSNPSPESLARLDSLPALMHQGIAMLVAQVRTNLFKMLLNLGMLEPSQESAPGEAGPTPPVSPRTGAGSTPVSAPDSTPPSEASCAPGSAPIGTPEATSALRAADAGPPPPADAGKAATPAPSSQPGAEASPADAPSTKLPAPTVSPLAKQVAAAPVAKPYAVAGIRNAIRQREISGKRAAEEKPSEAVPAASAVSALAAIGMSPPKLAAAAVLILGLGYFVFVADPANDSDIPASGNTKEGTYEVSRSLKMHVLCSLQGKVLSVEPDKTVKFKIGERVFILEFQIKPPVIIGTEEAEVDLVPYLQTASGEIFAQCYGFKAK